MYSAILCSCICKPAQASKAEELYCEALNGHFGSAEATEAAFLAAKEDDFSYALWLQADYKANCLALADIDKHRSPNARFEVVVQ